MVIIDEAAKNNVAIYSAYICRFKSPFWTLVTYPLMWSCSVVVMHIFPQDRIQMPFVDDDQLVEALLTDGADPAFRVGIGIRRSNRRLDDFKVLCSKDLIKGPCELRVMIVEKVAKGWHSVFQRPRQLACLLRDPVGSRTLSTACDVNTARAQFNEKEPIPCKNSIAGKDLPC